MMRGEIEPLEDLPAFFEEWQLLQQQAESSLFQSARWMKSWLKRVAASMPCSVFRARSQGSTVALGILVARRLRRRGLFVVREWRLHEGLGSGLNVTVEYNGLLVARGHESQALSALLVAFGQADEADELVLSASTIDPNRVRSAAVGGLKFHCEDRFDTYRVRRNGEAGLMDGEYLSANSRAQLRRAFRRCESSLGKPVLRRAQTVDEALAWFSSMGDLHQLTWERRGQSGSFANPQWQAFHREVIEAGFEEGIVAMLELRAGERVVGYLYNLCWGDTAYNIQSGLDYDAYANAKPGYIAHALAIDSHFAEGLDCYDMLMGDAQYKRSFSNERRPLYWWVIQKPLWGLRIERLLVSLSRRLRGVTTA